MKKELVENVEVVEEDVMENEVEVIEEEKTGFMAKCKKYGPKVAKAVCGLGLIAGAYALGGKRGKSRRNDFDEEFDCVEFDDSENANLDIAEF